MYRDGYFISVTDPITTADRNFQPYFITADSSLHYSWGYFGLSLNGKQKFILEIAKKQVTLKQCEPLSLVPSVQITNGNMIPPSF